MLKASEKVYLLSTRAELVSVASLSFSSRKQLDAADSDFFLRKRDSRRPAKVIGPSSAALLKQFVEAKTLSQALKSLFAEVTIVNDNDIDRALDILNCFIAECYLVEPADGASVAIAFLKHGDSIGPYLVKRPIQCLSDSQVYLCNDPDGHPLCVKTCKLSNRKVRAALEHEASTLKLLEGALAPRLIGVFETSSNFCLASEWIDGLNLGAFSRKIRGQDVAKRDLALIDMCIAVAEMYDQLHQLNILHGDVHPGNVLVSQDGNYRLLDFGLSRLLEVNSPLGYGGVAYYMAPEAFDINGKGEAKLSALSEQFSLAALLFQVLTGHYHLQLSIDKVEACKQIRAQSSILLHTVVGFEHWHAMSQAFARALSKSPDERFPNVREFAQALKDCSLSLPPPTPRLSKDKRERVTAVTELALNAFVEASESLRHLSGESSLMAGTVGSGYLLYRLALNLGDAKLLGIASLWSDRPWVISEDKSDSQSSICFGEPGVLTVRAMVAAAAGDIVTFYNSVERLLAIDCSSLKSEDYVFGIPGILVSLIRVRELANLLVPSLLSKFDKNLNTLKRLSLDCLNTDPAPGALIGFSHGRCGLLYSLCQCFRELLPSEQEQVCRSIHALKNLGVKQDNFLRWPRKRGGREFLQGWCNGAAGFTLLWLAAFEATNDEEFLDLARASVEPMKSIQPQGVDLCCGLAGQIYALQHVAKVTAQEDLLSLALTSGIAELEKLNFNPQRLSTGLFKGELGLLVAVTDLLSDQPRPFPFVGVVP